MISSTKHVTYLIQNFLSFIRSWSFKKQQQQKKNPFLFLEMLVGEQGGGDKGILEYGTLDQMNGRYSDLFFAIWCRISKTMGANVLHTKQCYFSQLNLH